MRLRCLAAVCAALLLGFGQAARADLLIKIDKSQQQMTVSADGEQLYSWAVSTGRRGYNTPSGNYTPFRMDRHHFSEEWDDAPMPYSIFFTKQGHAIHGTYEARHLGRAVSHGCVRLSVKHAAILWKLVKEYGKKNTIVELTGKIPATAPRVAHARRSDKVTGSASRRAEREDQRTREQREDERYSNDANERVYSARERRYKARERYYGPPPRFDRRYAESPGYYDRYDGPPPVFPFFLLMRPRGY